MLLRLQKYLAEAGVTSRRAGEQAIREGRVAVNGTVVREMGVKVETGRDRVTVDGVSIKAQKKHYLAVNKPAGYVCSRQDPERRKTIGQLLPKEWAHLYTVGRLDYATEGLIFLTNDGEFALRLTHPRYGVRKKYHAVVEGKLEPPVLKKLTDGLFYEGERLKAEKARVLNSSRGQTLVELELAEGKYREARRLFEAQGLRVLSLKRIQIGPIKLGELRSGRWRALTAAEVKALLGSGDGRRKRPEPVT